LPKLYVAFVVLFRLLHVDHIHLFLLAEFEERDGPDRLLEDVEVGEEVTQYEEQDEPDDASDDVAECRGKERGEEQPQAHHQSGEEEQHNGIDEDAQ